MAAFQETLAKAAAQLKDLTLSQRIAILLGAALVVGSLIWMVQWAAQPEMTPLIAQDVSTEELARIQSALDGMNVDYRMSGNRVLVPTTENRPALLARLQMGGTLPDDTSGAFKSLVEESNPWLSQEENARRWTYALQQELSGVLSNFGGVQRAEVFLNLAGEHRGFSRNAPRSSASVTLFMKGSESVTTKLAKSAANFVAGAVKGLSREDVSVVDGSGNTVNFLEPAGGTSELDRRRREEERERARKIRHIIAFDPNARVSVQVELETRRRETHSTTPTDGTEVYSRTHTKEAQRTQRADQPGAQPNTGVVAGGAQSGGNFTTETERETALKAGETTTHEVVPPGEPTLVTASVSLSRGSLARIWRIQNPDAEEGPTEDSLEQIFASETSRLLPQIRQFVKPREDAQVALNWHYEPQATLPGESKAGMGDALSLAKRFGPVSGLALLALLSLGLMARLAKGGSGESFGLEIGLPEEAIEAARKARADVGTAAAATSKGRSGGRPADEPFAAAGIPAPEGLATEGVLEGQEIDDASMQTNKMVEELSAMVESDADGVAAVLDKWIDIRR